MPIIFDSGVFDSGVFDSGVFDVGSPPFGGGGIKHYFIYEEKQLWQEDDEIIQLMVKQGMI